MMIKEIENMLGKPYGADLKGQSRKFVCWKFCRDIYKLLGLHLSLQHQTGLTRIENPEISCIVLFCVAGLWHAGVVWPDTLHFIHAAAADMSELYPTEYIVCKERLTSWPYKMLIEGFYESKK